MKNILLKIAYDGSGFHGWQRQPGKRTVQGELEKVLTHTLGKSIRLDGTSRTDAGVHAYGQQATFSCDTNVPVDKLPMILNNSLAKGKVLNESIPGDIRILKADEVASDFHARFDSAGKKYSYKIFTTENYDIFRRNYFYQMRQAPDIDKMREAAGHIIGTHDFKSFESAGGNERESTVRTIYGLNIYESGGIGEIIIDVIGDGFLYNMVRIMTGTLVEAGLGRIDPHETGLIIKACDRTKAGHTAPPEGLYLAEVYYDKKVMMQNAMPKDI